VKPEDLANRHLQQLRSSRNPRDPDLTLDFLRRQFRDQVERPFRQLGPLGELWSQLVPAEMHEHTRLEGLQRGTLRVAVDSAAHLYELDRLLRGGLERQMITGYRGGSLRRVKLVLSREAPDGGRRP
jgi:hypothetical protein